MNNQKRTSYKKPQYRAINSYKVSEIFNHIDNTYELKTLINVISLSQPSIKNLGNQQTKRKITKVATAGVLDYLKATKDDYNSTLNEKEFNLLIELLVQETKNNFLIYKTEDQKVIAEVSI
jgi:hypothetical protein